VIDYVHLPPYRVDLRHVPKSAQDGVDWGIASYGIPSLWMQTLGQGVTVAVVDSGIAPHSALPNVTDHRNFSSDSEPYDTLGHGTHVAGIIGAVTGAAKGIAPHCKILSLKVLGHSGMWSNYSVAQAVRHAADAKVDIVCMSLGSPSPSESVHQAIKYASGKGVIVVCAAGNDGGAVNFPAAFSEVIAVGAVDRAGNVCEFSSRGKEIEVAAPGQDITSTWLGDGYATISGTSMAAPFVAGVLALYISAHGKATPSQAMDALIQTCRDMGLPGHDSDYGWGLLDPVKLIGHKVSAKQTADGVTIFIPGAKIL
jgi:subtilisin family serine protease